MEKFDVRGTQARPAGIPLFVLSHNNFHPRVEAHDDALVVKVVTTNRLPWSEITRVRETSALLGHPLAVTCRGWEYILHFRSAEERERLRATLRERGVSGV